MKQLCDLSWLEILHMMAASSGSYVNIYYATTELNHVYADIHWRENNKPLCTGLEAEGESAEVACEKLIHRIFSTYKTFPGSHGFKILSVDFSSKEEFVMKLIIAGIGLKFMLGHHG